LVNSRNISIFDEINSIKQVRKVKEIIKMIEADGWQVVAQKGSHRQYKHQVKKGRVTVPGKLSDDLHPKTEQSILKQAGLK
jgi:predicted RNA binding protein YcfA (HicA-like mRNA interferase family)